MLIAPVQPANEDSGAPGGAPRKRAQDGETGPQERARPHSGRLRGLSEPVCRAAKANAPFTGPVAPSNPVAPSDPDACFANSRTQHDATQGPTGRLTVGPSTGTHRISRCVPRTRRATPSAITPSRMNGRLPCETVLKAVKDPPGDPGFASPRAGGQSTGSQAGTHECRSFSLPHGCAATGLSQSMRNSLL